MLAPAVKKNRLEADIVDSGNGLKPVVIIAFDIKVQKIIERDDLDGVRRYVWILENHTKHLQRYLDGKIKCLKKGYGYLQDKSRNNISRMVIEMMKTIRQLRNYEWIVVNREKLTIPGCGGERYLN